jgi:3-hydroxy-9,10-secoandrosta-1,3,5(10)-triene-9,17-dione monooxygenase reductase component
MLVTVPATQPSAEAPQIDGRMLRNVCGLFVTGVTVITTGVGGRSDGTTVNSFTSVSLDPPLVLFCLHRQSRLCPVIQESGLFVVNFLAGRQERLAMAFAGKETAAFHEVAHHRSAAGVPILSDALAFLACELVNEFEGGDHTIFLGKVCEVGVPRHNQEPLIFFRGSLGALEHEPVAVPPIWEA